MPACVRSIGTPRTAFRSIPRPSTTHLEQTHTYGGKRKHISIQHTPTDRFLDVACTLVRLLCVLWLSIFFCVSVALVRTPASAGLKRHGQSTQLKPELHESTQYIAVVRFLLVGAGSPWNQASRTAFETLFPNRGGTAQSALVQVKVPRCGSEGPVHILIIPAVHRSIREPPNALTSRWDDIAWDVVRPEQTSYRKVCKRITHTPLALVPEMRPGLA